MSHESPPLQRWLDGRKKIWMLLLRASKPIVDFGFEPFGRAQRQQHADVSDHKYKEADRKLRFPLLPGAIAK